jgi:hypothetical protein
VAEALTSAPERVEAVTPNARAGAAWRAELGITDPSPQLDGALSLIDEVFRDPAVVVNRPEPPGRASGLLAERA